MPRAIQSPNALPRKRKRSQKTEAQKADRYDLYLRSVQAPEVEVRTIARIYKKTFGKDAMVLREDFCGTAAVCGEWARMKDGRTAWGVDLDPEPLRWGEENNFEHLDEEQLSRVELVEGDVRTAITPPADVVAAQNFSFFYFYTRDELRAYFRRAYEHLDDEGMLFLDMYGGYQAYEDERDEPRDIEGEFTYIWEQRSFDPITHRAVNLIHFEFEDGSRLDSAFRYEWRIWTLPEVRELLLEAGFDRADVYWEATDSKTGEGTGTFVRREKGDADPAWLAYVVGVKGGLPDTFGQRKKKSAAKKKSASKSSTAKKGAKKTPAKRSKTNKKAKSS